MRAVVPAKNGPCSATGSTIVDFVAGAGDTLSLGQIRDGQIRGQIRDGQIRGQIRDDPWPDP
jgi:hypothetical protein